MGFLSKLRDSVKAQIQPGNMPMQELRAGTFMPNSPQLDRRPSPPRMPAPPAIFDRATAPVLNPRDKFGGLFRKLQEQIKNQQIPNQGIPSLPQNLDFLSRLPPNMMPEVDFSSLPKTSENLMTGMQPRMNFAFGGPSQMTQGSQHMMPDGRQMPGANHAEYEANMQRPGYAIGGPLVGRAANLANQVLSKNRMGRNVPGRATSNMGDMVMSGRAASPLTDSLRRGTENLIIGGTGAAAAIGIDGTQTFREPFSKDNVSFMSPEAFGTDLAQLRMDVGAVINLAQNKAVEMGENVGEYVDRVKTAYDTKMNQDMENQRMQEMDAQQGMQPFSALLGPDMPLRRQRMEAGRGRTLSNVDRMIEAGRGSTTSDIDDLLSSMEKKN